MTRPFPGDPPVLVTVILVVFILACGCAQQSPSGKTPAPVTVTRADSSHLTIQYPGSQETSSLLEIEATVTDSAGNTQTRSLGDKYSTTPLRFGATLPLTGAFNGKTHVLVTGYFMDSSKRVLLDTTI